MKYSWKFDAKAQVLRAPSGWTITVKEIAQGLQDKMHCRHDLDGPWAKWRIRGKALIGPHGERFTPDQLRQIATDSAKNRPEAAPNMADSAAEKPRLYLVR